MRDELKVIEWPTTTTTSRGVTRITPRGGTYHE